MVAFSFSRISSPSGLSFLILRSVLLFCFCSCVLPLMVPLEQTLHPISDQETELLGFRVPAKAVPSPISTLTGHSLL